tara:strand:+ start:259 stop:693 length:435 start_codon:yes stop_codon:yes gene_type:complete
MLTWTIKQKKNKKITRRWYTGWAIFSLILLILAIVDKSPVTVIAFVLISAMVLVLRQSPGREVNCQITNRSITINNKRYSFKSLKSFSVTGNYLTLIPEKVIATTITIPLKNNKKEVKTYLKTKLKETKRERDFVDALSDKIGL